MRRGETDVSRRRSELARVENILKQKEAENKRNKSARQSK